MVMQFSNLTGREQAAAAIRRRWQLHVPKPKACDKPLAPALVLPANHCQGDRSCPFPPLFAGRCRQHARDVIAEGSPVGNGHGLLRDYGLVASAPEEQTGARAHNPALPRCRTKSKPKPLN
jgi:hypothetical protein